MCIEKLKERNPDYQIITYSIYKKLKLPNDRQFIIPRQCSDEQKYYKSIFVDKGYFKQQIEDLGKHFTKDFKINNTIVTSYILNNYRNGWALYNPYYITRELQDICYMGNETENYIDIILKNSTINKEILKQFIGSKTIVVYYSRNGYHYTKMDKENYYIKDNLN